VKQSKCYAGICQEVLGKNTIKTSVRTEILRFINSIFKLMFHKQANIELNNSLKEEKIIVTVLVVVVTVFVVVVSVFVVVVIVFVVVVTVFVVVVSVFSLYSLCVVCPLLFV
jgi:hypothetical protein